MSLPRNPAFDEDATIRFNADMYAAMEAEVREAEEQAEQGDTELFEEDNEDHMTDVEADANTLASAGWGMDEDYGVFDDPGAYDRD